MSVLSTFMKFEAMRELSYSSISSSYVSVGNATGAPIRQMIVSNLTNQNLYFSFDGVTDHFVLAANTQWISDITTNKTLNNFALGQAIFLYVKAPGTAPSSGLVCWSTIYASDKA